MDQKQKKSLGVGVMVGVIMFMAYYWGVFGPSMDLVGSMGTGFGFGFSASIVSYMMSRDEEA